MSAPTNRWQLTILFRDEPRGVAVLEGPQITIGRGVGAQIELDDNPVVSRNHARLNAVGSDYVLEDLGSGYQLRVV